MAVGGSYTLVSFWLDFPFLYLAWTQHRQSKIHQRSSIWSHKRVSPLTSKFSLYQNDLIGKLSQLFLTYI